MSYFCIKLFLSEDHKEHYTKLPIHTLPWGTLTEARLPDTKAPAGKAGKVPCPRTQQPIWMELGFELPPFTG